jgi:predicted Zn-dependent peptidase
VATNASPQFRQGPRPSVGVAVQQCRVESFTLDNGLTFVVLPRSPAPVVSCHIYAGVGAWEEQDGQTGGHNIGSRCCTGEEWCWCAYAARNLHLLTKSPAGLAHLLEHLAFKGTRRIGSKDWATESQLLNSLDESKSC